MELHGHIHDMHALLALPTKISAGWSDYKSAGLNAGVSAPKADAAKSSNLSRSPIREATYHMQSTYKHILDCTEGTAVINSICKNFVSSFSWQSCAGNNKIDHFIFRAVYQA